MREILFKAKRVDNGEWVVGQYVNTCYPGNDKETGHFIVVYPNEYHEIYTSTVCQCTGFFDEDGKEIFEGDIVGFIDCTSTENGYSERYCIGRVLWDEETGSFQVTERLSAESYEVLDRGCKVIGNILDNQELLEQED